MAQNPAQRQVSIDVEGGVIILEVPDKKQSKVWGVMSQYVRVLQKYLGYSATENEPKIGIGSNQGDNSSLMTWSLPRDSCSWMVSLMFQIPWCLFNWSRATDRGVLRSSVELQSKFNMRDEC